MLYPSRTARLALRAWREKDRPAFAAMNADERVMEYFPATLTAEESADLLDRIRDEFSTDVLRRAGGPGRDTLAAAARRLGPGLRHRGGPGMHRTRRETRHSGTGRLHVRRKRAFPARDAEARHDVRRRVRPPRPARGASPAQARPLSHPDRTMKKSATCQRSRTSPFRLRNHFNSNSTVPRISSDAAPT